MDGANLPYRKELDGAVAAVLAAGSVVRAFYEGATAATYEKGDGSPVTDADLAADRVIRQVLAEHFPTDPILSEEGQDDDCRLGNARCWIVDPVDGTEQFILRTGEFDVLVALVEDGRPVAVAGYQPTTGLLVAAVRGGGAWMRRDNGEPERIHLEPAGNELRLATSKWFGAPKNEAIVRALAARLGIAAENATVTGFSPRLFLPPRALDVMIGIRPGEDQTMASEWDFAVTDLVIHEAGGVVTDLDGRQFHYNKPISRNAGGLIAAVDPITHARVTAAVRAECASSPLGGYAQP
ncbi:MAG: 3'(2'),5'-bisphosphate nucleotidase CysQ family protein [Thermomicrobiales bacterium]